MQLKIRTLTGRTLTMDFEPSAAFRQVKEALQEKEGIDVTQIRLLFGGKQCVDAETLEFAKVKAGDSLHMVLALRGGSC